MVKGLLADHNVPTLRERVAARMAKMVDGRLALPKQNRIFYNCVKEGINATAVADLRDPDPKWDIEVIKALRDQERELGRQIFSHSGIYSIRIQPKTIYQINHDISIAAMEAAENEVSTQSMFSRSFTMIGRGTDGLGLINPLPEFPFSPRGMSMEVKRNYEGLKDGMSESARFMPTALAKIDPRISLIEPEGLKCSGIKFSFYPIYFDPSKASEEK